VLALLANWIPDPTPDFGSSPTPFVLMFLSGFLLGALGHLFRSKVMVAAGVGIVFLGTFLLPLALYLSKSA
jgi:hypothetical protein